MAKITITMGMNVPLYKDSRFDRFTPSVMIADIDTDGNVPSQIEKALSDAELVWSAVGDWIEEKVNFELDGGVTLPIEKKKKR